MSIVVMCDTGVSLAPDLVSLGWRWKKKNLLPIYRYSLVLYIFILMGIYIVDKIYIYSVIRGVNVDEFESACKKGIKEMKEKKESIYVPIYIAEWGSREMLSIKGKREEREWKLLAIS